MGCSRSPSRPRSCWRAVAAAAVRRRLCRWRSRRRPSRRRTRLSSCRCAVRMERRGRRSSSVPTAPATWGVHRRVERYPPSRVCPGAGRAVAAEGPCRRRGAQSRAAWMGELDPIRGVFHLRAAAVPGNGAGPRAAPARGVGRRPERADRPILLRPARQVLRLCAAREAEPLFGYSGRLWAATEAGASRDARR